MSQQSYQFKVGNFDCIVVNDDTFISHHPGQMCFANAQEGELFSAMRKGSLGEAYESPTCKTQRGRTVSVHLLLTLVTLILVFGTTDTNAQEMVTDGMVGFWSFDRPTLVGNTVKDLWGGHDGTIVGAPKVVAGQFGQALSFDGDDDLVEVPHHADLDLKEEVTIEFWFLLGGKSGDNDFPRPVSKGQSTSENDGYGVWVRDTSNPTDIGFRSTTLNPNDIRSRAVANYDDNQWHHVMLTYNGQKGKLFVDGEKLVDQDVSGEISQNQEPLHIGDGRDERHFNGLIDEVRLYNRGLSDAEVRQNFEIQSNALPVEQQGKMTTTWGRIKAR